MILNRIVYGWVPALPLNYVGAQLGVYLRLNDVAVPSIYGSSADENPFV